MGSKSTDNITRGNHLVRSINMYKRAFWHCHDVDWSKLRSWHVGFAVHVFFFPVHHRLETVITRAFNMLQISDQVHQRHPWIVPACQTLRFFAAMRHLIQGEDKLAWNKQMPAYWGTSYNPKGHHWRWASGFPNGTCPSMAQFKPNIHTNPKKEKSKFQRTWGQVKYCSSFFLVVTRWLFNIVMENRLS